MTIGEKIKQERKKKGLTQKQLADAARLAQSTIRQYEANKYKPKLEALVRISHALDIDISELAGNHISWPTAQGEEPANTGIVWIKDRSKTFGDVIDLLLFVMNDFQIKSMKEGSFRFSGNNGSDIITLFLKDYEKMSSLLEEGTITTDNFHDWFAGRRAILGKLNLNDKEEIENYMASEVMPRVITMKANNTW